MAQTGSDDLTTSYTLLGWSQWKFHRSVICV